MSYAKLVYALTGEFPESERFGLTSQLRRAAVSISANIAEGASRSTSKDFSRFIEIAYGSLMESVSEAAVAREQDWLTTAQHAQLYQSAERLARMLSGLRASLRERRC